MKLITFILLMTLFAACRNNGQKIPDIPTNGNVMPTTICDTGKVSILPVKDFRKELRIWTEGTGFEWFMKYRQSVLKDAKAWSGKELIDVDSNKLISCLVEGNEQVKIYIPNDFYSKDKIGNEYINFFFINNTKDTILLPMIDAVIRNLNTRVNLQNDSTKHLQWIQFQETAKFVECGNSYWTWKFPPKKFMKCQLDCQYLNLGDKKVPYTIALELGKDTIISNEIEVNVMPQQIRYIINGTK